MLAVATKFGARWYFLMPVGLMMILSLWAIMANPQTGSDLTAQRLSFFFRGKLETILVADIAHMLLTSWTDGAVTVTLYLKSGRVVPVPSMCANSKLAIALRDLGVSELSSNEALPSTK
jgi:hypothetical protein